jgi:hypothetical protein
MRIEVRRHGVDGSRRRERRRLCGPRRRVQIVLEVDGHVPPHRSYLFPPRTQSLPLRATASDRRVTRRSRPIAFTIRTVEYYYTNVRDELGAAYRVLAQLAELGVSLLAFTAVPSGPSLAQFTLFPEDTNKLLAEARAAGLALDGPHHALLVQGDAELGALAGVHERLVDAGVDIYASTGVTDGRGSFGYVVYVREDQFDKAVSALGV